MVPGDVRWCRVVLALLGGVGWYWVVLGGSGRCLASQGGARRFGVMLGVTECGAGWR